MLSERKQTDKVSVIFNRDFYGVNKQFEVLSKETDAVNLECEFCSNRLAPFTNWDKNGASGRTVRYTPLFTFTPILFPIFAFCHSQVA